MKKLLIETKLMLQTYILGREIYISLEPKKATKGGQKY